MNEPQKKGSGPKKVFMVPLGFTVPLTLIERLDAYAKTQGITRASAARKLIDEGLKAAKM